MPTNTKQQLCIKPTGFLVDNCFRCYQLTIITEDLGVYQSSLLSRLSVSSHCDCPLLSELKTNNLLSQMDRCKNYEII